MSAKIIKGAAIGGFPRSGNTWLNYIVTTLLDGKEPIEKEIVKSNHRFSLIQSNKTPILIVRDYKECMPRHFGYKDIENKDFKKLSKSGYKFSLYIKNLQDYDKIFDKALLVYYEELMKYPNNEILRIGKFIDKEKNVPIFLENYEFHKNKSLELKNDPSRAGTISGEDLHYHSKNLSQSTLFRLYNHFKNDHPKIFEKYLKCYV